MWRTVPVGGVAGGGPARPRPIFGTHTLTLGRTTGPGPRCPMGVLNEGEGGGSGAAAGRGGCGGRPGGGRPGGGPAGGGGRRAGRRPGGSRAAGARLL